MAVQNITVFLEFPPGVPQQDIRELYAELDRLEGVKTDLQTTRDPLAFVTLVVQIVASASVVAGGITSLYKVGEIFYTFLHREGKEKAVEEGKKKIVLKQDDKEVQIYGYSPEEIRQFLSPKS